MLRRHFIINTKSSIPNNEIWYTSRDGKPITPKDMFGVIIVSNKYNNGKGVITFDGPVTRIGNYAFSSRSYLTSITIPNSVTSIGMEAFSGCSLLNSITIGNGVTTIEDKAFYGCSKLKSITFKGTIEEWNVISKSSGWKYKVPATHVQCSDGQVEI